MPIPVQCTYKLFADMIHDSHDAILIPPVWSFDAFDFTPHDNYLTSWNELSTTIRCSQVRRHAGWRHVSVESLCQAVDHLVSSTSRQSCGWTRGQDEVSIEIYDKRICWCTEKCAAFCRDTQYIWTRFLDEILGMTRVYHWHVQTTPFKDPDAVPDGLGSDSEHGRVVTDEDDTPSRRDSSFDNSNDIRDG